MGSKYFVSSGKCSHCGYEFIDLEVNRDWYGVKQGYKYVATCPECTLFFFVTQNIKKSDD